MDIIKLTKETIRYLDQLTSVRNLKMIPQKAMTFISNPNNIAYFAIDGERVVGFVWGYILERIDSESMLYIHSVDVIEPYRRKGIAKQIMNEFLSYLKTHELRNVFLITDKSNVAANKLYQSLGGELESDKNLYIFK